MVTMRTMLASAGAVVAAGAAVVTGVTMRHSEPDETARSLGGDLAGQICFTARIQFFKDAPDGCVSKAELNRWLDALVLDNKGAPVTLDLSHPTDYAREKEPVRTCADYRRKTADDWYAASNADMRREAFFERACGVIDYLKKAQPPTASYFDNGRCSRADLASLADGPPFMIAGATEGLDPPTPAIEEMRDGAWLMSALRQKTRIREIAHADFNGDGVGDILAHVVIGVEEGTARAGLVGYLDKPGPDADVRFKQ
ncbi:MAG: hypothetical protein AAGJ73_03260 [Pseudomonadota bacterium]